MEQHEQTAVKTEAWARILEQIEIFQVEMEKHEIRNIVCHSTSEGNFENLSVFGYRHGDYERLTNMDDLVFEQEHFEKIRLVPALKENDRNEVIPGMEPEPSAHDLVSIRHAAMTLFDNIFEYVRASDDMDEKFVELQSTLNAKGAFNIVMAAEDNSFHRTWPIPDVTNTFRQLNGWTEREVRRFSEDMTDRFGRILETMKQNLERDYPGLGLIVQAYNKKERFDDGIEFSIIIEFSIMHEERRIDPDLISVDKLERIYPGLFPRLQDIREVYKSSRENITIDRCFEIHTLVDPVVKNRAEPEMPVEPVIDGLEMPVEPVIDGLEPT